MPGVEGAPPRAQEGEVWCALAQEGEVWCAREGVAGEGEGPPLAQAAEMYGVSWATPLGLGLGLGLGVGVGLEVCAPFGAQPPHAPSALRGEQALPPGL